MKFIIKEGIRYVVFDNLASLSSGASPFDENTKKDWAPIGSWLIDLKHAGCASDLVHHVGYSGHQRGFSGREDALDTSVLLKRPDNYTADKGCVFTLQFTKVRVDTKDLHLIQEYNFKLIDVDGKKDWEWSTKKKNTLIEALKLFNLGLKQNEIAKELKVQKSTVTKWKAKLISKGWMNMKGEVTNEGKEQVQETEIDIE